LLTAEFSEIFASYRLVAVTGGLMASLNIARPSEAKGPGAASSPSLPLPGEPVKKAAKTKATNGKKNATEEIDWAQWR
jgi:hypothetical protein